MCEYDGPLLVGLCTFDSTIHFYAIRPGASQPHMLVVPDVDEPYSPLPTGLVVPLEVWGGRVQSTHSLTHHVYMVYWYTTHTHHMYTVYWYSQPASDRVRTTCT